MVNYVWRVVSIYEKWANDGELSSDEIYEASRLLGTPTRRLDVFIERYSSVFSKLVEERCSETSRGRACIYSWSRRAYKRYFPAALDAGGTILGFVDEAVEPQLLCYPLHRAFDLDVRGVSLPAGRPGFVTPRLDGWQVNLYFDPVLSRWVFATRYVLHNMYFSRGRLYVEEYGEQVNPLVGTADAIARRIGLYARLEEYQGWCFSFMVVGREPASAMRRLPEPEEAEDYRLVLLAARRSDGVLIAPLEVGGIAEKLGVENIPLMSVGESGGEEVVERARRGLEYPSLFLWYPGRGDDEHPEFYEAKSGYYEEWVSLVYRRDAKALAMLLTSGDTRIVEAVEREVGGIVGDVADALKELEEALEGLKGLDARSVEKILRRAGLDARSAASTARALVDGKISRALRIVAARLLEGLGVGEASVVLESFASRIRPPVNE